MGRMRFSVKGLAGSTRRMAKRVQKMKQARAPMKRSITDFIAVTQKNFDSSGGAHQPPQRWRKLKDSTLKQKAKRRQSSMPLIATGHLKQDWIVRSNNPKRGEIISTARTRSGRGGIVWYGIFHHKGGKHLPKRRFLITEKHAAQRVLKHYGKHVVTSLRVT